MYELRPYQQTVKDAFYAGIDAGHSKQIVALGTGAGKTVVASHIIHEQAQMGKQSLFVVDRVELIFQAEDALKEMGLNVGILQGENTNTDRSNEVIVASIQTIRARYRPFADLIVIDECHVLHKEHIELMKHWFQVPVLGLSATPMRKGLGQYFSNLIRGPSISELMATGDLVKQIHAYCPSADQMRKILADIGTAPSTYGTDFKSGQLSEAVNRKELIGDIITTWQNKAADRQTLCFAVDIAHSKAITDDFRDAGIHAEHLDAYTDSQERRRIITAFRNHDVQLLSSVNVLGLGFDVPAASCAILARPTLSEMLYIQQVGRVLRPDDGKDDALILDHAGNAIRFGLPQHFIVPDLDEQDHATTRAKRKQVKAAICKGCSYVMESGQMTCPACGLDRHVRQSKITYLDGELVEYGGTASNQEYTLDEMRNWYQAFRWQAQWKNRKPGWAMYPYTDKFGVKPSYSWLRLAPVMPTDEQARWIKYYEIRQYYRYRKERDAQKHSAA